MWANKCSEMQSKNIKKKKKFKQKKIKKKKRKFEYKKKIKFLVNVMLIMWYNLVMYNYIPIAAGGWTCYFFLSLGSYGSCLSMSVHSLYCI